MLLPDLLAICPSAAITFTQATYIEVATSIGRYRIDFISKAEFRLRKGTEGAFVYFVEHPLLLDHNEPKVTLHLGSKPSNPEALIEAIEQCIAQVSHGWRTWRSYTFQHREAPRTSIRHGQGILLQSAPLSLARKVISICHQQGVTLRYFEPEEVLTPVEKPYSVLFLGVDYVIARGFRVQLLEAVR
ncbi:hypothetical protein [Hymenobacter sp. BT730]|uniref:hypothetical protein n=1 Tax=Hymenobacter sp. BT730 TaxID=3063332 RepID=UPI0026E0633C|nr:hypothetical protein [Hymenobacter sp. BT730]